LQSATHTFSQTGGGRLQGCTHLEQSVPTFLQINQTRVKTLGQINTKGDQQPSPSMLLVDQGLRKLRQIVQGSGTKLSQPNYRDVGIARYCRIMIVCGYNQTMDTSEIRIWDGRSKARGGERDELDEEKATALIHFFDAPASSCFLSL
jgi:hypothetical protein